MKVHHHKLYVRTHVAAEPVLTMYVGLVQQGASQEHLLSRLDSD